jgi:CheY-like chemotaxis protein
MKNNFVVLLIDDDPFIRKMFKEFCNQLSIRLIALECGEEAVMTTTCKNVDIIFLDVFMHKVDGLETLEKLQVYTKDVPVVGISGDKYMLQIMKNKGAKETILKPISFDNFKNVIEGIKSERQDS